MTTTRHLRIGPAQRLVLWCLLVALPVYGLSGSVIQLLGHAHFHKPAAEVAQAADDFMSDWAYFSRIGHGPQRHGRQPSALHAPAHDHDGLARHHHTGGDASVVVVDGNGADDGAAGGGNAPGSGVVAQMFVLPETLAPPAAVAVPTHWRTLSQRPLASHDPELPDKPPKA